MQVAVDRHRLFARTCLAIALVLPMTVLVSCAATGKNGPELLSRGMTHRHSKPNPAEASQGAPEVSTAPENDSAAIGVIDTGDTASADSAVEKPEVLIETAKQQCTEGNFAAADSSLRRAVRAVNEIDEDNTGDEDWFPASRYIDEIVAIYGDKMPPAFSVPEEITMAAFQAQMVRSLDSLQFMPSDSLSIATMGCQKGLSYDVPMVWNERVQRALFFYINHRSSTVDKWFLRAPYYLPVMRKMFADSGLPLDLAYLPLIESGFNPLAYSYAHASGIWQFISSTGKRYGLRHTYWIDERRDPLKATQAAISYLKKLYGDFSDWHLALAAYNCGENGVARCIKRNGTKDYWKLPLPKQTKSYVPFYLAAVTIAKNPKCFSIVMPPADTFALDTVQVNDCIVLNDIADSLGIPLDTIRKMNPHIMRWCTPPDVSNAVLYLPKGRKGAFLEFHAKLPDAKKVKWCRYLVQPGDNIRKIALQFNITVECIAAINHLKTDRLAVDRYIFLPMPSGDVTTTVAFIPPESHDENDFSDMTTYRVRKGDNLGKIARRYRVSLSQLFRLNRLTRSSRLKIGRVLIIRRPAGRTARPAPAVAVKPPAPSGDTAVLRDSTVAHDAAVARDIWVVSHGDTPYSIAKRSNITIANLVAWNSLDEKRPVIHRGDTLKLTGTAPVAGVIDSASTLEASAALPETIADSVTPPLSQSVPAGQTPAVEQPAGLTAALTDSASPPPAPIDSGTRTSPAPLFYKIRKGDNLFRVSLAFSIPLQSLLVANNLTRNSIVKVGDSVRIPGASGASASGPEPAVPERKIIYYKVKGGDTLWRIAASFGVSIEELYKHNNIKPDSVLVPGEVIKVIKAGPL